jgi:hypothetical protein
MHRTFPLAVALFAAGIALSAQTPATPPAASPAQDPAKPQGVLTPTPPQSRDVIRRSVDLVTTDLSVRDDQGQFVSNLGKNDFEVYEDGVKQDVVTFVLTHGGRVINDTSAGVVQEDREGADSPRRHVRRGLDRPFVNRHRHDLRHQTARGGDQQDLGRRPQARRDHRNA